MTNTSGSIQDILISLGYNLRDDGTSWRSKALYRGGKNSNSLTIYKDTGCWNDYGANLFCQPIGKLLSFHGISESNIKNNIEQSGYVPERIQNNNFDKIYPESSLLRLLPHYKFYTDKGISIDVLKNLNSGMAMSGLMYQRYVFPIYNKHNKIIGFSGRYMGSNPDRPKWKHIGKKNNWVYPAYIKGKDGKFFVQDAIKNQDEVIIVESIGDMLFFHSKGFYNVLVCFGLSFSNNLISYLLECMPKNIIISLNNDFEKGFLNNSGRIASIQNFLTLLKYFDYSSLNICLPVKKDFGEMTESDFIDWLKIKNDTDFNDQKNKICEEAKELKNLKKITEKSYKNLRLLNCE